MLLTGLLIAALNVIFSALEFGLGRLPLWFWLAQLLLLPAMLAPARLFPEASAAPGYPRRAGLYALGWAAPFAVYKLSGDALRPDFYPLASLIGVVVICVVFGLIFAAIRRPQ